MAANSTVLWENIRSHRVLFEWVLSLISYALNILVIHLARTRSNRHLRDYSRIIVCNCAVDIFFISVNLITMELIEIQSGFVYLTADNPLLPASPRMGMVTAFIWVFSLLLLVVNVPIQFIYRFNIFCLSKRFSTVWILGIGAIIAVVMTLPTFALPLWCNHGETVYLADQMLEMNPLYSKEEITDFVVCDGYEPEIIATAIYILLTLSGCYAIAYILALRIYSHSHKVRLSVRTIAAQRQLTVLMVLQAVYPLVLLMVPICTAAVYTVIQKPIYWPTQGIVMLALIAGMPTLNALTALFTIPPYRRAFLAACSHREVTFQDSNSTPDLVASNGMGNPLIPVHLIE